MLGCVCGGLTHLQQGPFITLGSLVAFLLLSIHCIVDPGKVGAQYRGIRRALPTQLFLLALVASSP